MFIPMQASPEAQLLGHEIAGLVRERQMQRPDISWGDVLFAFAIARETLTQDSGARGARARAIASLVCAALLAGGVLLFVSAQH